MPAVLAKFRMSFFRETSEIEWLPVETEQNAFQAPLRPLLDNNEMSAFVGIPMQTFNMASLPHERPDRDTLDFFSEPELRDRFNEAGRIFQEMGFPEFLGAGQKACQNRRGEAFSGVAIPIHEASPLQLEKQNRALGNFVYSKGVYFSKEGLEQTVPRQIKDYTFLGPEDLCFVPNTKDFPLITQLHELTHAQQKQIPNRPRELDYILEKDADSGSFDEYERLGGSKATVFTRIAARAVRHTLVPHSVDGGVDVYCYYPDLLASDAEWSLQKGILTQYDLKIRSAVHFIGQKCSIQPNDMMENLKALANKRPVTDRKFIQLVRTFDAVGRSPDAQSKIIKGFEKLWHSGEKLHHDTLHAAGIAYEALDLFRHGPRSI